MYTVLWQENGVDKWDRMEGKEEVAELLAKLAANENVCESDVWIFTPKADDYALEYDAFVEQMEGENE